MAKNTFIGVINGVEYTDPQAYGTALSKALQSGEPVDATIQVAPTINPLEVDRTVSEHPTDRDERSKTSLNKELKNMIRENDMIPMFDLDELNGDEEHDSDLITAFMSRLSKEHIDEILTLVNPIKISSPKLCSMYDDKLGRAFEFVKNNLNLNNAAKRQAHIEKARLQEQEAELSDRIEELENQLHEVQDQINHQKTVLHICYDAENIMKSEMEAYKAIHDHMTGKHVEVSGRVKEQDKASRPADDGAPITTRTRQVSPQATLNLDEFKKTGLYHLMKELGFIQ